MALDTTVQNMWSNCTHILKVSASSKSRISHALPVDCLNVDGSFQFIIKVILHSSCYCVPEWIPKSTVLPQGSSTTFMGVCVSWQRDRCTNVLTLWVGHSTKLLLMSPNVKAPCANRGCSLISCFPDNHFVVRIIQETAVPFPCSPWDWAPHSVWIRWIHLW